MTPPPLPEINASNETARAESRGRRALWFAATGYGIGFAPVALALLGMRGQNSFATLGVIAGTCFLFALIQGLHDLRHSRLARIAAGLGCAGLVFAAFHAPTCAAIYNALRTIF